MSKAYTYRFKSKDNLLTLEQQALRTVSTKAELSQNIGISYGIYRNIFRKEGGTMSISLKTLTQLRTYFHCSDDYILGESSDPLSKADGTPIRIIDTSESEKKREELIDYIRKNSSTLNNLHYLFCELDMSHTTLINKILDHVVSLLKKNCLLSRHDQLTADALTIIRKGLEKDNPHFTQAEFSLIKGNAHLSKNQYKLACKEYLFLIECALESPSEYFEIAKMACDKLSSIISKDTFQIPAVTNKEEFLNLLQKLKSANFNYIDKIDKDDIIKFIYYKNLLDHILVNDFY